LSYSHGIEDSYILSRIKKKGRRVWVFYPIITSGCNQKWGMIPKTS